MIKLARLTWVVYIALHIAVILPASIQDNSIHPSNKGIRRPKKRCPKTTSIKDCVFPFTHLGKKYDSCANISTPSDPWCATSLQSDGTVDTWKKCPDLNKIRPCKRKTDKITLNPGDDMIFQSENYPDNYPSKSKCKWEFKSTENITISCDDFCLEPRKQNGKCKKNSLMIGNRKYCGTSLEKKIESSKVKVHFKSNTKKNKYRGFSCKATANLNTHVQPVTTANPNTTSKCDQAMYMDRIIGGHATKVNQYPWMAALVELSSINDRPLEVICGGTVIASDIILTAGYCTKGIDKNNFAIWLDGHHRNNYCPNDFYKIQDIIYDSKYESFEAVSIQYPEAGGEYQINVERSWILNSSLDIIELEFISFRTEADYDFLYIRDGGNISSPVIGKYSGETLPPRVITSTNKAFILFTSDSSIASTGFTLTWKSVESIEAGSIQYPETGGEYQNNVKPTWILNSSLDIIELEFISFRTEENYDFLYIRDGGNISSPVIGKYSGDTLPPRVKTTTNKAFIYFTSDTSVTSTGFTLTWKSVDSSKKIFRDMISIIVLNRSIDFTDPKVKVQAICLPGNETAQYDNVLAKSAGWGLLDYFDGDIPYNLHITDVRTMNISDCQNYYENVDIPKNVICAGNMTNNACIGDGGGPLFYDSGNGSFIQIGIILGGNKCGQRDSPAVHSRTSHYIEWINKTITEIEDKENRTQICYK